MKRTDHRLILDEAVWPFGEGSSPRVEVARFSC